MSTKINLGLGALRNVNLVEVFKSGDVSRIEEVKEILVDAINILSLNDDYIKANKVFIRTVVNNFAIQCETYSEYYNLLISSEYSGLNKESTYENICKYLHMIASLYQRENEGYYDFVELASKDNFVKLYASLEHLKQVRAFEEVAEILNKFIKDDTFESEEEGYIDETNKNFNLDAILYIVKNEVKGILIDLILNNANKCAQSYKDTESGIRKGNIYLSIDTICDAYSEVYTVCKVYKSISKRSVRVSDKKNIVIDNLNFKSIYLNHLNINEDRVYDNLREIFKDEGDNDRW